MHELELEIKVPSIEKKLTPEEKAELDAIRIINGDDATFEDVEWRYVPITLNLEKVGPYNYYDDEHTLIRMTDYGASFMARINYKIFQAIVEASLGHIVKTLDDFHVKNTRMRK